MSYGFPHDDMWCLDTDVSSHIFYFSLDENQTRMLRFGDGSLIKYASKGGVHVDCANMCDIGKCPFYT